MSNTAARCLAAAVATCLTAAVVTTASAPTATAFPPEWRETPTGQPTGLLYAVDTSAGATWSVGMTLEGLEDDFRTLALRRDHTGWNPTAQPVPRGRLLDVAVRAPDDVWAAGEEAIATGGSGTKPWPLAQRWNGRSWRVVPAPSLTDVDHGGFTSVATTGRADGQAWISGWTYSDTTGAKSLVYRHDRKGWHSITDRVAAGFGYVNDLLPMAGDDIWAAHFGGIGHYDGRRWTRMDLPGDDTKLVVMSLAATGPTDVWAAGLREDPTLWRRPVVLHYDGVSWTEVPTPAEPAQLNSIELVNGTPVAVGETPAGQPYVVSRVGSDLVPVASPPRAGELYGTAVGDGRLWVAGAADDAGEPGKPGQPYLAVARTRVS